MNDFWGSVIADIRASRAMMHQQDFIGALDMAMNAKERIERSGRWPKELAKPEFSACCSLDCMIDELKSLVKQSDINRGLKGKLKNGTSYRSHRS